MMSKHLDGYDPGRYRMLREALGWSGPRGYNAIPLRDAANAFGPDVIVSDGESVWHTTADGEVFYYFARMTDWAPELDDDTTRLVAPVAVLAPGEIRPAQMPEPLEGGERVRCTLHGKPAIAVRIAGDGYTDDEDELAWVVIDPATTDFQFVSWDEITDPRPWDGE